MAGWGTERTGAPLLTVTNAIAPPNQHRTAQIHMARVKPSAKAEQLIEEMA